METLVLVIHLLTAVAIIGMILLQQGKGADAGASFGAGASQTLFGSAGTWNFFSKVTAILATVFFVTSFGLAIIAKTRAVVDGGALPELKILESSKPAAPESDVPEVASDKVAPASGGELPEPPPQSVELPVPQSPARP